MDTRRAASANVCTHHADGVKQAVLDERVREARAVAAPLLRVAVADLAEDPGEVDARAAAGEEQVVVELVLLARRALQRRALDGEHDGAVVGREEDVPAEAVGVGFPADGVGLEGWERKWSVRGLGVSGWEVRIGSTGGNVPYTVDRGPWTVEHGVCHYLAGVQL